MHVYYMCVRACSTWNLVKIATLHDFDKMLNVKSICHPKKNEIFFFFFRLSLIKSKASHFIYTFFIV